MESNITFSDLFEEIKLKIFKYLSLSERIKCAYVSREWSALLSSLSIYQKTVVIGQPEFDSTARMKLSLCNINHLHVATPFNTITNDLIKADTNDEGTALIQLVKSFNKLKSIFIYAPVKIKLSDLPDTIEHIHFGHNTENVITFDKVNFAKLTCISTIDAHLDERYMDGLTHLLRVQKLQLENVSVCEVPRGLCEQIVEMQNLKQLYVFDFESDFDNLYKEKKLEIMDAHPKLQYFNMFSWFPEEENSIPTDNIRWLIEFGCKTRPLDRNFIIDVFKVESDEGTLDFAKDYIHGLYLIYNDDFDINRYTTKLNSLVYFRLTYKSMPITTEDLKLTLQHILNVAPNMQNLHLRFFTNEIFGNKVWIDTMLKEVCVFTLKNAGRPIVFELSALGLKPDISDLDLPTNLNVVFNSLC